MHYGYIFQKTEYLPSTMCQNNYDEELGKNKI